MCAISLGASDLELCFANKRATSLPGDDEMEYTILVPIFILHKLGRQIAEGSIE